MFNFGIIGPGKIAHQFCKAIRLVDGAVVAAVASKSAERAAEFAAAENVPAFYGSYEAMLDAGGLDAVYIATTHNFHLENALLCLNKGVPLLIEKSMATSKKDADLIFDLASSKGLFVMEAMWSRFLPHVNKAREWIAAGAIGKPVAASCTMGRRMERDPLSRMFNPALGGGALYDVGVYAIELMTYLLGRPDAVRTMVLRGETGVDVTDNILLVYDGCLASILLTFDANINGRPTAIYGELGRIEIPDLQGGHECTLFRDGTSEDKFTCEMAGHPFVSEIEETMRCVRGGLLESPAVPHADTIMCCEIFDLALGE